MPWTPWIDIEPEDTGNPEAKELYRQTRHPVTRRLSDLTRITSQTPAAAAAIQKLGRTVFSQTNGLTLREKEIAALVTSAFNGCVH